MRSVRNETKTFAQCIISSEGSLVISHKLTCILWQSTLACLAFPRMDYVEQPFRTLDPAKQQTTPQKLLSSGKKHWVLTWVRLKCGDASSSTQTISRSEMFSSFLLFCAHTAHPQRRDKGCWRQGSMTSTGLSRPPLNRLGLLQGEERSIANTFSVRSWQRLVRR